MKFEIEIDQLQPGSVIDQTECERVIGYARSKDKYEWQFALMQLAEHVNKLLWRAGKHWTVTTSNGEIVVLTHEEASKHNAARFRGGIAKMRRSFKRLNAVDVRQIGKAVRHEHDEEISRQSRILQGMRLSVRDVTPEPVRKSVPIRKV